MVGDIQIKEDKWCFYILPIFLFICNYKQIKRCMPKTNVNKLFFHSAKPRIEGINFAKANTFFFLLFHLEVLYVHCNLK